MTGVAESRNFGGVEMVQMEFVFVLWGAKTISRLLWLYFPNPVVLRHAPFFSETLSYCLQEKSIGEHLKKTERRGRVFLPCTSPAPMVEGSLHLALIFEVSLGFS